MLDHIGWGEIFFIVVLALIIIGPERLPGVLQDLRAAVYAARKAIDNAKAELDGDLGGLGEELKEFKQPLAEVARWQRMGPRRALTTALFEGDDHFLDDFDPKKIMAKGTAGQAARENSTPHPPAPAPAPQPSSPRRPVHPGSELGSGFNWQDIM